MVPTSSLPMGAPAAPRVILTPEQTTAAIVDLSNGMAEMRLTMQSILQYLHASMPTYAAPPQPSLPFSQQMLPISYPYGMPTDASPSSSTSPSLIPSFTTPAPCRHSRTAMASSTGAWMTSRQRRQLQAVAYCLLPRRQGRQHPIFKRRRPVVPTAAALQLTERKAIARASACKVFAAVRLQAAARGLLAHRRLQKMCSPMPEATLAVVDLSIGDRNLAWSVDLAWSDGH
jgi:hypothetical protein